MIKVIEGQIILDKEEAKNTRKIQLIELSCGHFVFEKINEYIQKGDTAKCLLCKEERKVVAKTFFVD